MDKLKLITIAIFSISLLYSCGNGKNNLNVNDIISEDYIDEEGNYVMVLDEDIVCNDVVCDSLPNEEYITIDTDEYNGAKKTSTQNNEVLHKEKSHKQETESNLSKNDLTTEHSNSKQQEIESTVNKLSSAWPFDYVENMQFSDLKFYKKRNILELTIHSDISIQGNYSNIQLSDLADKALKFIVLIMAKNHNENFPSLIMNNHTTLGVRYVDDEGFDSYSDVMSFD